MRGVFKVLIISILLFYSNSCLSQTQSNVFCSLRVDTVIMEKIRGEVSWVVFCSILNNSERKMKYWSMSCSWTDFFQIDNPELVIDGFECKEENSPTIIEVDSKASRQIALRLYSRSSVDDINRKTKIGFRFINGTKTLNLNEMIN